MYWRLTFLSLTRMDSLQTNQTNTEQQLSEIRKEITAANAANDVRFRDVEKKVAAVEKEFKNKGDLKKAAEANEKIMRSARMTEILDPEFLYMMVGRGNKAREEFQAALKNSDNNFIYEHLARSLMSQGAITHIRVDSYI